MSGKQYVSRAWIRGRTDAYDDGSHLGDDAVPIASKVGLDFDFLRRGRFEEGCERIHLKVKMVAGRLGSA